MSPRRTARHRAPGRFCLLALFAGAVLAPAAAAAYVGLPQAQAMLASLGEDEPVVAYRDYPFPEVPEGELWRPSLKHYSDVTAVVPSGNSTRFPESLRKILADGAALADGGQGVAATALLEQHADTIPDGHAYSYLARLHRYGKGDLPADPARALAYALRWAESNPAGYLWLGEWNSLPKRQRLHYLSKGLSRGCRGCAEPLIKSTSTGDRGRWHYDVPMELRFAYAVVAVDLGDARGPFLLDSLVVELSVEKNQRGVPKDLVDLAAQLMRDAYTVAGTNKIMGVRSHTYPAVVYNRMRSGLVPGDLLEALAQAEKGVPTQAAIQLLHNPARGRLAPPVINRVMAGATQVQVGTDTRNSLTLAAAEWGDMYRWAGAALVERAGLNRVVKSGGRLQVRSGAQAYSSDAVLKERAASFTALALASPATPDEIRQLLQAVDSRRAGNAAAGRARECIDQALASSDPASMIGTCEGVMTWAWANSDEVDFGVLSDALFARLGQQADAGEAATLRRRYREDVDARLGAINEQRREEDRRLAASGYRRSPLNSQQALTQAREDVATARAGAARRAGDGVVSYRPAVDRLHRGYLNQRDRVRPGSGQSAVRDALRQAGTREVCADWSYRYLATCPSN